MDVFGNHFGDFMNSPFCQSIYFCGVFQCQDSVGYWQMELKKTFSINFNIML